MLVIACLSCSPERPVPGTTNEPPDVLKASSALYSSLRADLSGSLRELSAASAVFLSSPDTASLDRLRQSWTTAHAAFLRIGFIAPPPSHLLELVDAWPVQEGFLDALPAYPESGIVSDITLEMIAPTIRNQHQITSSDEVSLGFHAIEYFAFARSIEDFIDSGEPRVERRRRLLELLVESLQQDVLLAIPDDPTTDGNTVFSNLLSNLRGSIAGLYTETTQLVRDPHARFAGNSRHALQAQIGVLEQMLFEPVNIGSRLVLANARTAGDITHNVRQIAELLGSGVEDEEIVARCGPLLLGLDHQLREFIPPGPTPLP